METQPKRIDWIFIIGLILLVFGYAVINLLFYLMLAGAPFYLIGAAMIAFSRKSRQTKLIIIGGTLLINIYTFMAIGLMFSN